MCREWPPPRKACVMASLPDPVGEIVRGYHLENGLRLEQVRVPIGVLGMIYEARPNVTVDVAFLMHQIRQRSTLRGGHAAERTNAATLNIISDVLAEHEFAPALVASVDEFGRAGATAMMEARGHIDVLIPRGSRTHPSRRTQFQSASHRNRRRQRTPRGPFGNPMAAILILLQRKRNASAYATPPKSCSYTATWLNDYSTGRTGARRGAGRDACRRTGLQPDQMPRPASMARTSCRPSMRIGIPNTWH